ncbi:MAG TPA: S1/P1 nuclease, partial [Spongiibacteraceae bacterium]|nr:S1/P1 nuclease [Spongiibacteraceae bacterium]
MFRVIATLLLIIVGNGAHAWGNKGHEVIAHIAWHYLKPSTRAQIDSILRSDTSGLTTTDFIGESTWADVYRDSDRATTRMRYEQTRRW